MEEEKKAPLDDTLNSLIAIYDGSISAISVSVEMEDERRRIETRVELYPHAYAKLADPD